MICQTFVQKLYDAVLREKQKKAEKLTAQMWYYFQDDLGLHCIEN